MDRYVVDSGRAKRREYNHRAGTSRFVVDWISKASADQRAGRAGRTGPGHCYRLYSAAVYGEQFPPFEEPEVARMPIESVILQLKDMGIVKAAQFPFPSPPPKASLQRALHTLYAIGALEARNRARLAGDENPELEEDEALTPLGAHLSHLPVHPRLGKILVLGSKQSSDIATLSVALVAGMTIQEVFIRPSRVSPSTASTTSALDAKDDDDEGDGDGDELEDSTWDVSGGDATSADPAEDEEQRKRREAAALSRARFQHPLSDALTGLRVLGAHAHACVVEPEGTRSHWKVNVPASLRWCRSHFLRHKSLQEASQLREQLHGAMARLDAASRADDAGAGELGSADAGEVGEDGQEEKEEESTSSLPVVPPPQLPVPSESDERLLRQLVAAGLLDRVARRIPVSELNAMGWSIDFSRGGRVPYMSADLKDPTPLFVHSNSATCRDPGDDMPDMVVFEEIVESRHSKACMKGVTAIEPSWLPRLSAGTPLCSIDPPLETPPPKFNAEKDDVVCWRVPRFGGRRWALPAIESSFPEGETRTRWFARLLLEGHVLPPLQRWFSGDPGSLCAPASMITKRAPQRRVLDLVEALHAPPAAARAALQDSQPVDSVDRLGRVWAREPAFLREELAAWLPKEKAESLRSAWGSLALPGRQGTTATATATAAPPASKRGVKRKRRLSSSDKEDPSRKKKMARAGRVRG